MSDESERAYEAGFKAGQEAAKQDYQKGWRDGFDAAAEALRKFNAAIDQAEDQAGGMQRYFTTETLKEACEAAYLHDFNQTIDRDAFADLPADGVFPVLAALEHSGASRLAGELTDDPHNYPHVRCIVQMPKGTLSQDTLLSIYEGLPFLKPT